MSEPLLNVEAEQNLLGSILVNNEVFDRVSAIIRAEDFSDPVHASIFQVIAARISCGDLASPITLKQSFEDDPGLSELGGVAYLARLAGSAISLFAAPDYAKVIADLSRRRALAEVLQDSLALLNDPDRPVGAAVAAVEAWALSQDGREDSKVIPLSQAVIAAVRTAQDAMNSGEIPGVTTGIRALDNATGGLQAGDFIILGGRASMGKTAVALSIALGTARANRGVLFCSLEMSGEQLALRALSEATARAGRPLAYHDIRRGVIRDNDFDTIADGALSLYLPIEMTPRTCRDIGTIASMARQAARRLEAKGAPLSLIVVDYLQLVQPPQRRHQRHEEVQDISAALKALGQKMNVPVLALSQINRGVENREDKRPTMSDLRESGSLEQDADVVMLCYREEYYLQRGRPENHEHDRMAKWQAALARCAGFVDLIIAKQRMGSTETVRALLDPRTNWLRDVAISQQASATNLEGFA